MGNNKAFLLFFCGGGANTARLSTSRRFGDIRCESQRDNVGTETSPSGRLTKSHQLSAVSCQL